MLSISNGRLSAFQTYKMHVQTSIKTILILVAKVLSVDVRKTLKMLSIDMWVISKMLSIDVWVILKMLSIDV